MSKNVDRAVVEGFGDEWTRFDQFALPASERETLFNAYFKIFPWDRISRDSTGVDVGCGSGRWATLVAPRVRQLHCVDASEAALAVARRNLAHLGNCAFHQASIDALPLRNNSLDFGYSLGVLHHVPEPAEALRSCVKKLKPGAPFLVYLYYAFENRPTWFRLIWRVSDLARRVISRFPNTLRFLASQVLAFTVYWPLARTAGVLERIGLKVDSFPLSSYRHRSLYVMRTDALDRFGTRLEKRFSKDQILVMMERAGLEDIRFSDDPPFWCAVGTKVGRENQGRRS